MGRVKSTLSSEVTVGQVLAVVTVLVALGAVGVAMMPAAEPVPWEDAPLATYRERVAEVEAGDGVLQAPSPIGAWVIARGAAIEAGAGAHESAAAAHFARWEQHLPCWSADDAATIGHPVPVCAEGAS